MKDEVFVTGFFALFKASLSPKVVGIDLTEESGEPEPRVSSL